MREMDRDMEYNNKERKMITWNEEKQDWVGYPEYQPIPDQEELDRQLEVYGIAVVDKDGVVPRDE